MNSFFTDNFHISKIVTCLCVPRNSGPRIHINRPSHGLVFELSGVKSYEFSDGSVLSVRPGDVFYLPKFSSYEFTVKKAGECIAVNYELSDEALTYPQFVRTPPKETRYEETFRKLLKSYNIRNSGYLNTSLSYLYKAISDIQRDEARAYLPEQSKKPAISAAQYIKENLSDSALTVESLALKSGISPEYLRRIFSSVYGVSPKRFIINARMSLARELLLSRELSVSAVAHLCGYDNESYFSTEFKKHYGKPPVKYE